MKNFGFKFFCIIFVLFVGFIAFSDNTHAQDGRMFFTSQGTYNIGGIEITNPFMIAGESALVSFRAIGHMLGWEVTYNDIGAGTGWASLTSPDGVVVRITKWSSTAEVNNRPVQMVNAYGTPIVARIIGGRFFVPIRFFNDHPQIPISIELVSGPPQGVYIAVMNIVGTWESDDVWGDDWRERIRFNSDGTGIAYEINIVTGETWLHQDDEFTWSISGNRLQIIFIDPWDLTEWIYEYEFRVITTAQGDQILSILDGNVWFNLQNINNQNIRDRIYRDIPDISAGPPIPAGGHEDLVGRWEFISDSGIWLFFFETNSNIEFFRDGTVIVHEFGDIGTWHADGPGRFFVVTGWNVYHFTYTISGNILIITDEHDDHNTYRRIGDNIYISGNDIVGNWESLEQWEDWTLYLNFDLHGTGSLTEFNTATEYYYTTDLRWAVISNTLHLTFADPWDPTGTWTNILLFRITTNAAGDVILSIHDGGWLDFIRL